MLKRKAVGKPPTAFCCYSNRYSTNSQLRMPAAEYSSLVMSWKMCIRDRMPSMRQDVLAKRPTEVEQFAGVVRRLAQKHGMPTPANDFFYEKDVYKRQGQSGLSAP